MSSYRNLSQYYDRLTENVEYEARSEYISGFFSRYGIKQGDSVLDVACGTGRLSKLLSDKGYAVSGLDLSEDMLVQASKRCAGDVLLYNSDMTSFEFDKPFNACVCSLDAVNHLESIDEVKKCFSCIAKSLLQGGIFIFDVNTIFKHREILSGNTFVFDDSDFFLSWDNEAVDERTVRIFLDLFILDNEDRYERFSESFCEKAYSAHELVDALCDFEVLGVYDDMSENAPTDESERIYFVCKRK